MGPDLAADRGPMPAQVRRDRLYRAMLLEPNLDMDPVLKGQPRPRLPTPWPDPARLTDPVTDRPRIQPDHTSRSTHLLTRTPRIPVDPAHRRQVRAGGAEG